VLRRANVLRLERRGHRVHVVPADARPTGASISGAHGSAGSLYARLPPAGGATQRELASALGLSRQLVSHHLRALTRMGLAREVGGFPKRYVRLGR
jgi:DNA-binding transcriptional ArsR family regulator